jgi:DNA-binding transcriptional LysR family regulator
MESKWLEDFISLAETHSFNRSAQQRDVPQSDFSRRIKSLVPQLLTMSFVRP